MKILQKMAMIVMVIVVAGNADGMFAQPPVTVLDLPANTPGRASVNGIAISTKKMVGGSAHPCVYVIVPGTEADRHKISNGGNIVDAMNFKGVIYFSADGSQPTTLEAVEYSCANVGVYDLNSPITKWYMRMFGWIPDDDLPAGADHDDIRRLKFGQTGCSILFLPMELIDTQRCNRIGISRRQLFGIFFNS